MSDPVRADALGVATRIVDTLRPWCERIEIAGSRRRQKPMVKDMDALHV